jgi:hypothetical protein
MKEEPRLRALHMNAEEEMQWLEIFHCERRAKMPDDVLKKAWRRCRQNDVIDVQQEVGKCAADEGGGAMVWTKSVGCGIGDAWAGSGTGVVGCSERGRRSGSGWCTGPRWWSRDKHRVAKRYPRWCRRRRHTIERPQRKH